MERRKIQEFDLTFKKVSKSNNLIEARYRLGLKESQIILWLLTQIKPDDEGFKRHKLSIKEFAKLTQVEAGSIYTELPKITERLMKRIIKIQNAKVGALTQVSWLSSAHYEEKKGYVLLEFSPQLKPFLLQLKSRFTKIRISDTLQFKSVFSIRLYELISQYESVGKRTTSIDDIRYYFGIGEKEYSKYSDIKRYVIEKAKTEINEKTDYQIDYTPIKESRKIVSLEWKIKKKQKKNTASEQKELRSQLALREALMEHGFGITLTRNTLQNNPEEVIKNSLKAVDIQVKKGIVKNPKAMLRTAIKEQWHPERYKIKKAG